MHQHKFQPARPPRDGGFTLIELLLVVGVVAILSSVAIVTVSNVRESTQRSKLQSDVATINAAIQVYQVNGGTLPDVSSLPDANKPDAILAKLKTRATDATAPTISGLRSNMVDLRLQAEMQEGGEPGTSQPRALWDGTARRFVVASSGGLGVKNFLLNDALAAAAPALEPRTATIKTHTDGWVWAYTDVAPSGAGGPGTGPGTSTASPGISPVTPTPLQLNPPVITPAQEGNPLSAYDFLVQISNPNPAGTSQIFYYEDGGALHLYTGQSIMAEPGKSVTARAVTSDPDHWTDSADAAKAYTVNPKVTPSLTVNVPANNVTYAEAGGAMTSGAPQTLAPATITLNNSGEIPAKYQNSSRFRVYSTLDGASPLTAGTAGATFSNGYAPTSISLTPSSWGSASSLTIKAAARALDASIFNNSSEATQTISITPTALAQPVIDPPSGSKAADLPVSIALAIGQTYPVGAQIYYTLDGSDPGNASGSPTGGTLYTNQFSSGAGTNGVVVVTARVYGPAGFGRWFTPSPAAVTTYQTITLADGALVGSATLNGTFVGSLVYATPAAGTNMNSITFNANAKILGGNLYLPGTPTVRQSNGTVWSVANDSLFSAKIQGWEYDANGNKTVQTTPRVLDENGSITPNNYSVTFNNTALLEGKVIRRHNSPAFPVIAAPPAPDSGGSTSLNSPPPGPLSASQYSTITINSSGVGDVSLNAGHYANLTANNGTAFVLGDPNHPEITQYYSFQSLNLNSSSDLKIVGKVIITVGGSMNLNSGSVLGNSAHPEWLQLQFSSGDMNANSGSTIYGQLVAPTSTVSFNAGSVFRGSVTAQSLVINSSSIVFDLPPIIQN
ncbi:MAG: chitobiase/beta-hexosaminidase C-terminal domain-containing protein [Terrimicrobiaceae bacterium]|nr:chitobiase/beta-hexosaminidase C-terminal domain-containing protein [Terrimicrobiaceae bacterium]